MEQGRKESPQRVNGRDQTRPRHRRNTKRRIIAGTNCQDSHFETGKERKNVPLNVVHFETKLLPRKKYTDEGS